MIRRPSRWRRATVIAARGTILTAAVLFAVPLVLSTVQPPGAKASRVADDDDAPRAGGGVSSGPTAAPIVHLDRDGQAKGGIVAARPAPARFQDAVQAYGTVVPLDRLTTLFNAALAAATQLHAAETKAKASRVANDRARNLLKVFSTAQAQAEAAQAVYDMDAVAVETARAQIEALRNSAIQDWGPVVGAAIVDRSVFAQDLVLRRTCLVQLSVPPGAATRPPPHLAFVFGGASVDGRFVSEAATVDPKAQAAGYFYVVPAAPGILPGVSTTAALPSGAAGPGLGIPPAAVVWQAGRAWLYLNTAPDTFERRPVDVSAVVQPDGGYVLPASSLPKDEAIVVSGAQTLLSQESRAQIPSDGDDN